MTGPGPRPPADAGRGAPAAESRASRSAPVYSVSVWSTPHNTIWMDIEQVARTDGQGIGLWAGKWRDGEEPAVADALRRTGLRVTSCAPRLWTILPVGWASPTVPALNFTGIEQDPVIRTRLICQSLERLAPFAPDCILLGTGAVPEGMTERDALDVIARGLAQVADAAGRLELRVGFELTSARRGAPISRLSDLVRLIDDVGRPNVGVVLDVFHSAWNPDVCREIPRHADRLVGLHVNDVPVQERGLYDRALPGEGRGLAARFVAAALQAGYDRWYELEVFSDDGTFAGRLPDSLWALPHEEMLRRAKAAFDRTYRRALELAAAGVADRRA